MYPNFIEDRKALEYQVLKDTDVLLKYKPFFFYKVELKLDKPL